MVKFDTNFNLDEQEEIDINFELNPQGVNEHQLLTNRDLPDQHPISAITGLETILESKLDEDNLPIASQTSTGIVQIGNGLEINEEGLLSSNIISVNNKTGIITLNSDDILYQNQTITEIFDELLYVHPTVTLTGGGNFENGNILKNKVIKWTVNKNIISQSLNQNIGSLDPSIREYNIDTINSNKTYTITVNDGKNTASSNTTFNFLNKRYWGVSENEHLDNSQILLLNNELSNSRTQTRTFDCSGGKYFYFAIPTSLCNGIQFKVGGLSFSAFEIETIDLTNSYNYTIKYNVYRSSNIQTGSSIQVQVL